MNINSANIRKRNAKSARLKWFSLSALVFSGTFLAFFLIAIISKGLPAFQKTEIQINVVYEISYDDTGTVKRANVKYQDKTYKKLVSRAWYLQTRKNLMFETPPNPDLAGQKTKENITVWALADDSVDQFMKGQHSRITEDETLLTLIKQLKKSHQIKRSFNTHFFTHGDSKKPESAGIRSAMIGTLLTMLVTMAFALPIGVMTALYLEEFAPKNTFTRFIEVNINNLAAIPSILYGLLGLAIFISFIGVPRSSALVGGLTLGLMTLPTIIIATRAALRAVPQSIRQAAYGVGASKWQAVRVHVLPLALPGILTGSIIGLAQAIGETAPLIIIGMNAFIPEAPDGFTEAATVLPAQIFSWANEAQTAFVEKTAAAIVVLLTVVIFLNALAVFLRKKFERRW